MGIAYPCKVHVFSRFFILFLSSFRTEPPSIRDPPIYHVRDRAREHVLLLSKLHGWSATPNPKANSPVERSSELGKSKTAATSHQGHRVHPSRGRRGRAEVHRLYRAVCNSIRP